MAEQTSSGATGILQETFKVFVNLLKEFPKSSGGDFIYDDATIKKIKQAAEALAEMESLSKKKTLALKKEDRKIVEESVAVLAGLLGELPRKSSDEFLYDRVIHQKVENAREAIVRLGGILP
jgi:hypothetical protein